MEDLIATPIVFAVALGVHAAVLRQHTAAEGRLLTLSFGAHVVSSFGQILLVIYYYGYGDLWTYHRTGSPLADALRVDFERIAPELVAVFFHGDSYDLPVELLGGETTATMVAITAFLLFVVGNSIYAASLAIAVASYVSKILIYRVIRRGVGPSHQQAVLIATTLVPSAVFWSSTILKEPIIVVALGPLLFGLRLLLDRRRPGLTWILLLTSGTVIVLLKPYVLLALSCAAAVYYVWDRLLAKGNVVVKPLYIVFGLALGTAGFVGAASYFETFSVDSPGSSFAAQRRVGYEIEGGSNFYLESSDTGRESEDRSAGQELLLAPFALATALFRPLLFEARNAVQFVNALETTVLLILFLQVISRNGLMGIIARLRASPTLLFCIVFTFTLALGTGLASSNIGTLSRYRSPMMPFYVTLLLVLRYSPRTETSAVPARRLARTAAH